MTSPAALGAFGVVDEVGALDEIDVVADVLGDVGDGFVDCDEQPAPMNTGIAMAAMILIERQGNSYSFIGVRRTSCGSD